MDADNQTKPESSSLNAEQDLLKLWSMSAILLSPDKGLFRNDAQYFLAAQHARIVWLSYKNETISASSDSCKRMLLMCNNFHSDFPTDQVAAQDSQQPFNLIFKMNNDLSPSVVHMTLMLRHWLAGAGAMNAPAFDYWMSEIWQRQCICHQGLIQILHCARWNWVLHMV